MNRNDPLWGELLSRLTSAGFTVTFSREAADEWHCHLRLKDYHAEGNGGDAYGAVFDALLGIVGSMRFDLEEDE